MIIEAEERYVSRITLVKMEFKHNTLSRDTINTSTTFIYATTIIHYVLGYKDQKYIPQVGECACVNYAEQWKLLCVPSRLDHYSAPWYCLLQLISWPTTVIDVMTISKL